MVKRITVVIISILLSAIVPASGISVSAKIYVSPFDTVIILDSSESMSDFHDDIKDSALEFCREILDVNKRNRIAVVSYSSYAYKECELTDDYDKLENVIEHLPSFGQSNMTAAFELAYSIISDTDDTREKNIIILSDGAPCAGGTKKNGHYNDEFPECDVRYANKVYAYVTDKLHPEANVYSIGFFDDIDADNPEDYDCDTQLMIRLMKDISDSGVYFPDSAEDVFDGLAADITANGDAKEMSAKEIVIIAAAIICLISCIIVIIIFCSIKKASKQSIYVSGPVNSAKKRFGENITDNNLNRNNAVNWRNGNNRREVAYGNQYYIIPAKETRYVYGISGTYEGFNIEIKDGETIRIGRDAKFSNLVITEDFTKVSRTHCKVTFNAAHDCFYITDVSMNGTYVKNDRLPYDEPVKLRKGDEFVLAQSSNVFRLG